MGGTPTVNVFLVMIFSVGPIIGYYDVGGWGQYWYGIDVLHNNNNGNDWYGFGIIYYKKLDYNICNRGGGLGGGAGFPVMVLAFDATAGNAASSDALWNMSPYHSSILGGRTTDHSDTPR